MTRTAAVMLMATWLGGCGMSHQYQPSAIERVAGPRELVLEEVSVQREGRAQRLTLDAPVFAGDRLALEISLPTAAYVYVVNIAPDGTSKVVWPSDAPRLLEGSARIPESSWFELAGPSGPEVVALIATSSRVPLSERGREALLRFSAQEAGRPDLVKLQASHPPGFFPEGHATMGMRGEGLHPYGQRVRVRTGDSTVALLLDLDHRPVAPRAK